MDITEYSKYSQLYTAEVPPLLANLLNQSEWTSLVDLGCGDGALLDALDKQRFFDSKSVYAVDLSQSRLDLVQQINGEFTCLASDVCQTSVEDSSIDVVVSTQVIEHVQSDADMAKEMHRILSPNGRVYLATVFKKWYGWYFYRCNGKWTLDPTHLREYGRDDQLLTIIEDAGLEVLETRKTQDGRAIVDSVLRRLRAKRNVYENSWAKRLRAFRVPIPGYYIWEIICKKNDLS